MKRTLPWLLIGAVAGALVTYKVAVPHADAIIAGAAGAGALASGGTRADNRAAAHRAAYAEAARLDSAAELEQRLTRALASPFSLQRDAEVGALFRRLAALDVGRALRVAEIPRFDAAHLAGVIRGWAQTNPNAAMQALGAVRGAAARRTIALALLEAFGDRPENIERIAAALPEHQRIDFIADAFASRAHAEPLATLADVMALRDLAARNAAAQRVGLEWARIDPIAALAEASRLPPEVRAAYLDVVSSEWARLDADGFLAYADAQPSINELLPGMTRALAADPEAVFEIARSHPPVPMPNFGTLERISFSVVAEQNPHRALELLESIPGPEPYNQMRAAIAEAWTRTRPAEALEWARSLDPIAPGIEATVIAQTAILDVDQGLRLLAEFDPPANHPAVRAGVGTPNFIANTIGQLAAVDPRREQIANALAGRVGEDDHAAQVLRSLTQRWVQTDPESALDWMLANEAALDRVMVTNMAAQLASRDAATAAAYAARMPPDIRSRWFPTVAPLYAQQDPQAAIAWVQQFQGEPGYENVLGQMIGAIGSVDPQSAGMMLSTAAPSVQRFSATTVASEWANEDLAGAARWAAGLDDPEARNNAIGTIGFQWGSRDMAAAQRWVSGLPRGELRDSAAIPVLLQVLRNGGELDRRMIQGVSAEAVETAVTSALSSLAYNDPDRARALVEEWVTSPATRARAVQMIESF